MAKFDLDVLGSTGLKITAGQVHDEYLARLQGVRGVRTYREMTDLSPVIGMLIYLIETFVLSAPWRFEPGQEDSEGALEQVDFMDGVIEDMSHTWESHLEEVLSCVPFGWAWFEVVYKRRRGPGKNPKTRSRFDDNQIGWRKIERRDQESLLRWEMDEDGGIRGMWQLTATNAFKPVFLPIERSLLFRVKSPRNNPEGRSALRNSVRPYDFVKNMEETEAIGIDRDLVGLPVMQVPPEILSSKPTADARSMRQQLERVIRNVKRDQKEGILIPAEVDSMGNPTQFKLSLLGTGGRRQIVTGDVIKRYETRIAQTFLAEFVMLGMDKVGSFSLASSKTNTFARALGSLMDKIAAVYNRFAIPNLMRLNGVEQEFWPRLVHGDLETPPLDEIAQFVTSIASAGVDVTQPETQRKLREMAGLPITEDDTDPVLAVPDATATTTADEGEDMNEAGED